MQEKTGYRIASFNIEKFSKQSVFSTAEKATKKDLDTVARIIRENEIDIIAIQEISHPLALKELLEIIAQQYAKEEPCVGGVEHKNIPRLSNLIREVHGYSTKHWEGRWAKPGTIYRDKVAEGYAFIWNKDRIKLVTNYKNEVFEPRIGYRLKNGSLVRPPFVGRFMPIRGRFEFRLINTHIAWKEPSRSDQHAQESTAEKITDYALRINELETLLGRVYASLSKKQYDENQQDRHARPLAAYTFLLGDYNLNLPGKGVSDKIPSTLSQYTKHDMEIITVNDQLTTLRKPSNDPQKEQQLRSDPVMEHHLANNYDHFSYDKNRFAKIASPKVDVIYAFDYYTSNNEQSKYDQYQEKVSDHLPIILDIDIRLNQD